MQQPQFHQFQPQQYAPQQVAQVHEAGEAADALAMLTGMAQNSRQ